MSGKLKKIEDESLKPAGPGGGGGYEIKWKKRSVMEAPATDEINTDGSITRASHDVEYLHPKLKTAKIQLPD